MYKPFDFLGADMKGHIILVSRNESLIATRLRGDFLRNAGYLTTYAESLGRAVALVGSLHPDLVILDSSYSEHEKTAFLDCIHESHLHIHVLCLKYGDARPELLIKACVKILSRQPGSGTVHSLQEFSAKSV